MGTCGLVQAFRLPGDVPWAKFLQFHFQSHYGSEAVCALNDVRIFGKTASEDLEDSLAAETLDTSLGFTATNTLAEGGQIMNGQDSMLNLAAGNTSDSSAKSTGHLDSGQPLVGDTAAAQEVPRAVAQSETLGPLQGLIVDEQPAQLSGILLAGPSASSSHDREHALDESLKTNSAERLLPGRQPLEVVAGERDDALPAARPAKPVLDSLAAGLRRLIASPGNGGHRNTFHGAPAEGPSNLEPTQPEPSTSQVPAGMTSVKQSAAQPPEAQGKDGAPNSSKKLEVEAVLEVVAETLQHGQGSGQAGEGDSGSIGIVARPTTDPDLLLAAPSTSRGGGSIYDMLVAEIKALKLQQKQVWLQAGRSYE